MAEELALTQEQKIALKVIGNKEPSSVELYNSAMRKFTKKNRALILTSVSMGHPLLLAAQKAGISEPILDIWMKRGKEEWDNIDASTPQGEFGEFRRAILRTEAETGEEVYDRIRQLGEGGIVLKEKVYTAPDGSQTSEKVYSEARFDALKFVLDSGVPNVFKQEKDNDANRNTIRIEVEYVNDWRNQTRQSADVIEGVFDNANASTTQSAGGNPDKTQTALPSSGSDSGTE